MVGLPVGEEVLGVRFFGGALGEALREDREVDFVREGLQRLLVFARVFCFIVKLVGQLLKNLVLLNLSDES